MAILYLSLIVQGVGGLFLFAVCCALYVYRRRPFFLSWMLSWLCFSARLLLQSLSLFWSQAQVAQTTPQLLQRDIAVVCGWWHLALWVLGLLQFRRRRAPGPSPLAAVLAAVAAAAVAFSHVTAAVMGDELRALAVRSTVLSAALAGVYGWSSVVFFRHSRAEAGVPPSVVRRQGAMLLAVAFALFAAQQLHATLAHLGWLSGETGTDYLAYLGFIDFLVQTVIALGMVIVLLDDEQETLRDALERLAESEERFRMVFDHSGVGMALLTGDGRMVQTNPALARMLGYEPAELVGQRLNDRTHPEDGSKEVVTERPTPPGPVGYEREKRYLRKDGGVVWARVLRVPVCDAAGRLRYLVGVLVDITEKRRAEEALAASERLYRLRFQSAFDGTHVWSDAEVFLDANPAFCRMLGYSREELLRLGAADVAVDLAGLRRQLGVAWENGGHRFQTRLRRKDGGVVEVEASAAVLEVDDSRQIYVISRDLGEQQRVQEALQPQPGQRCVLVVDDEDLLRTLARAILERGGFRVLTAADGAEGLDLYRAHAAEIDVVLLDYTMPGMDGLQVMQELRGLNPDVRVIFSSGYLTETDGAQVLAAGARAFVPKPYRPADLDAAVREVLA